MTTAEQLRTEEREKTLQEVLVVLLEERFGLVPPEVRVRIASAGATELTLWTRRFATAVSLQQVFEPPAAS